MENSEALEDAVKLLYEPAYRFARSLVRSESDARELTQEAFSRLFEKRDSIRNGGMKSWLFTTLYRVFLGWKRRRNTVAASRNQRIGHRASQIEPHQVQACDSRASWRPCNP